jgi:hypothetical protein
MSICAEITVLEDAGGPLVGSLGNSALSFLQLSKTGGEKRVAFRFRSPQNISTYLSVETSICMYMYVWE